MTTCNRLKLVARPQLLHIEVVTVELIAVGEDPRVAVHPVAIVGCCRPIGIHLPLRVAHEPGEAALERVGMHREAELLRESRE